MPKFEFEIIETLKRVVSVEADDLREAEIKIERQYYDGDIVLDSNNDKIEKYEINVIGGSE